MTEIQKSKLYDLEERTLKFAKLVIVLVNKAPKTLSNVEICRQLVRSAGSVGANYIFVSLGFSILDLFSIWTLGFRIYL